MRAALLPSGSAAAHTPVGGPEFNLGNDIAAVNVVFGSTMAVWQVPKNVYEMMPVSLAELDCKVRPQGTLVAGYLTSWTPTTSPTLPLPVPSAPAKHGCWATTPAPGLLLYEHRFAV